MQIPQYAVALTRYRDPNVQAKIKKAFLETDRLEDDVVLLKESYNDDAEFANMFASIARSDTR